MNNWKKMAAAAILAGAVVMIQGCGGNGEEAKSMEKGRVWKAATEAAYPPFRYVDENRNLVGFEVDLLKEIAAEPERPSSSGICPLTDCWTRWPENRWTWP